MRQWEPLLNVTRVRIIGYSAWCSCGWTGDKRKEWSFARADQRWHECPDPLESTVEIADTPPMPAPAPIAEAAPPPREKEPR